MNEELNRLTTIYENLASIEADIDGYLNHTWEDSEDAWNAILDALQRNRMELKDVIKALERGEP